MLSYETETPTKILLGQNINTKYFKAIQFLKNYVQLSDRFKELADTSCFLVGFYCFVFVFVFFFFCKSFTRHAKSEFLNFEFLL